MGVQQDWGIRSSNVHVEGLPSRWQKNIWLRGAENLENVTDIPREDRVQMIGEPLLAVDLGIAQGVNSSNAVMGL